MLAQQRPDGPGWFQRAFRGSSDPKPGLDASYLDQLLWVRREYRRTLKMGLAGLVLLAVAVVIGILGWIVLVSLFAVLSGTWVFTFVRLSRRIDRVRREEPSEGYPTAAGS